MLFASLVAAFVAAALTADACHRRSYSGGIVCVCNARECDDIEPLGRLQRDQVAVYTSNKYRKRLERANVVFNDAKRCVKKSFRRFVLDGGTLEDSNPARIVVKPKKTFQKIVGFGGAFTDAAGINIKSLSPAARERLLESYFGENGIEYSFGRVPIASNDFSTRVYSYLDTPDDFDLKTFRLADEDFEVKIPFIRTALELTRGQLRLFATPWSSPGWMKTNGEMKGGGRLLGEFNGKYYETYAKYFVRFFEEYSKNGIPFWGFSIQNDPGFVDWIPDLEYPFQAMHWTHEMQREFANKLLVPTLRKNDVTKDLKVMAHDTERNTMIKAAKEIYEASEKGDGLVDGLAVHWYIRPPYRNFATLHEAHPDKFILGSEACIFIPPWEDPEGKIPKVDLGSWQRGEDYGHDIIQTLRHWVVAWTDWNLVLDEEGGPNWINNHVDAAIIVNKTADEFYKQPTFYFLGHFSKFIRPESIRVDSVLTGDCLADTETGAVEHVAFTTPQNKRVLVLHNRDSVDHNVVVQDAGRPGKSVVLRMEPKSIKTLMWRA
ncbi:O-glycosyl hydrolase family 30 protein [Aphelenchoides avenae]|nr:O-glycosyl hydrolase family 30 protein [Aphelenchus avenae]